MLARFAESVYLISPAPKLKVNDNPILKEPNIKVLLGYTVTSIEGKEVVEKIRMVDTGNKVSELELAGVFIYLYGSKPITDFLPDVLDTDKDGCIQVTPLKETSVPGVFAAGDVTCTEVRQVVVAASDGCISALSAEKYISQRKGLRIDWGK